MIKKEYEVVVEEKIVDTYTFIVEAYSAERAEELAIELVIEKKIGKPDNHIAYRFVKQVWSADQGYERQKK